KIDRLLLMGVLFRSIERKNFPFLLTQKGFKYENKTLEEQTYQTSAHKPFLDDLSIPTINENENINCRSTLFQWLMALSYLQSQHFVSFCQFSFNSLSYEDVSNNDSENSVKL